MICIVVDVNGPESQIFESSYSCEFHIKCIEVHWLDVSDVGVIEDRIVFRRVHPCIL